MSIIIAKIENNQCKFFSDTKVSIDYGDKTATGKGKLRMLPEEGVLKIHILTPKICIGFAGNVEICSKIIQSFIIKKPESIDSICQYFQDQLISQDDISHFIVGLIYLDSPLLYKIDRNNIEKGETFWIGEYEAFKKFQEYFNLESQQSILDKSTNAFKSLIKNNVINTVGDFIISVYLHNNSKSFVYQDELTVIGGYSVININSGETETLTEGTAEEGSYVISNLISDDTGKPAICLYFSKGKTGFLYIPISETNINIKPIVISSVTRKELNEEILKKYEINLIGFDIENGLFKFI